MNHIAVFHGAEHKVGCTMLAQSVAELIAKANKEIDVLFTALNGRKSAEYVCEDTETIDRYKPRLHSRIGIEKSLLKPYKKSENLYIIAGVEKEEEARHYYPEDGQALLESLIGSFDLVVVDSGSELDNGLALSALKKEGICTLVFGQSESSLARYERMRGVYERAEIHFDRYLINQFIDTDPYTLPYISSRLGLDKEQLAKVAFCQAARQAEMEHKTLLDFKEEKYRKDIAKVASAVMAALNISETTQRRKRGWKSFI